LRRVNNELGKVFGFPGAVASIFGFVFSLSAVTGTCTVIFLIGRLVIYNDNSENHTNIIDNRANIANYKTDVQTGVYIARPHEGRNADQSTGPVGAEVRTARHETVRDHQPQVNAPGRRFQAPESNATNAYSTPDVKVARGNQLAKEEDSQAGLTVSPASPSSRHDPNDTPAVTSEGATMLSSIPSGPRRHDATLSWVRRSSQASAWRTRALAPAFSMPAEPTAPQANIATSAALREYRGAMVSAPAVLEDLMGQKASFIAAAFTMPAGWAASQASIATPSALREYREGTKPAPSVLESLTGQKDSFATTRQPVAPHIPDQQPTTSREPLSLQDTVSRVGSATDPIAIPAKWNDRVVMEGTPIGTPSAPDESPSHFPTVLSTEIARSSGASESSAEVDTEALGNSGPSFSQNDLQTRAQEMLAESLPELADFDHATASQWFGASASLAALTGEIQARVNAILARLAADFPQCVQADYEDAVHEALLKLNSQERAWVGTGEPWTIVGFATELLHLGGELKGPGTFME
jgi:hypothetical protein